MNSGMCLQGRDGVFRDLTVVLCDLGPSERRLVVCERCGTEFRARKGDGGFRKRPSCPLCTDPMQVVAR
jgi:hypothetical protein